MKQILQNLSNGDTSIVEIPCPKVTKGSILIATSNSLVSVGTERMLVDFGKSSMLKKASKQPEKVKQVIDKVKTDGLITTIDAVRSKLDQPIPLGYCNAGVVIESRVKGFSVGDRVATNGFHAEVVRVSKNLCARIPHDVDDESAAFTPLAAIGLQGIRLLKPSLGETIVVFGLGLVGLMTVQMLLSNGCRVLGIDYDSERCDKASTFGADIVDLSKNQDPLKVANIFSRGFGVDGVIITASSNSNEIVHQAAEMSRKRGRIILVGVVGLELRRDDFFKKEISFQVSSSYGPGRYDPLYEDKGYDYPIGFVRWTEQRNFEAVLDMMASGLLDVKSLITHRFDIDQALDAYNLLNESTALGILLNYPAQDKSLLRLASINLKEKIDNMYIPTEPVFGFIGAGNYSSRFLIPIFKGISSNLDTLVTSSGVSGIHHGNKAGFRSTSTDLDSIWLNSKINCVVIVTPHNQHADQIISALNTGKNVFVEKPLAIKLDEINAIDSAYKKCNKNRNQPLHLMVGFNRRFAPFVLKMKSLLSVSNDPKTIVITVNAGSIQSDHWTQDQEIGGGRIIGEVCHFIDLMRFIIGHSIISHHSVMIGKTPGVEVTNDKVSISLVFKDGSIGTIHYFANGGQVYPKERIEVFCGDAVLQLNNYRELKGFGWPGFRIMKALKQDKGQKNCIKAFINSMKDGKESPIPYEELIEVSRVSINVSESLI